MEPQTPPAMANLAQLELIQRKLRLDKQIRNGVDWFYWIAGLSLVNSVSYLLGNELVFIFGLGITRVVDALTSLIAEDYGSDGTIIRLIGFAVNILIAGIFVVIGVFGRKRRRMPIILGMLLYIMDGVVLLVFQDFPSIGLHIFALLSIGRGLYSLSELENLEKESASESIENIHKRISKSVARDPHART